MLDRIFFPFLSLALRSVPFWTQPLFFWQIFFVLLTPATTYQIIKIYRKYVRQLFKQWKRNKKREEIEYIAMKFEVLIEKIHIHSSINEENGKKSRQKRAICRLSSPHGKSATIYSLRMESNVKLFVDYKKFDKFDA